MPCSSSETGAGSSWESCCNALTAFLSAPPATSSRTEALLNSNSRSRPRDSRLVSRGNGIGSRALLPVFASPLADIDNALLSSTAAVSSSPRPASSHDYDEGSTHEEGRLIFYNDAAFVPTDGAGQTADADVLRRSQRLPYPAGLALGNDATGREALPSLTDGRTPVARPEQQEQPVYRSALASAARAGATSLSTGRSAAAFPVVWNASVVPTAAPSAVAAASTGAAPADSACRAATPEAVPGISVADGSCRSGQAEVSFTPWRSWPGTVHNGVVSPVAEAGTAALLRASLPSASCGRTALPRVPETEGELVDEHTSQQLRRRPHASTELLSHVSRSQWKAKSNTAGERNFAAARSAETGDVTDDDADSVDSLLVERTIHGTAAVRSSGTCGADSAAKEERSGVGAAPTNDTSEREATADWHLNEADTPAAGDGSVPLAGADGHAFTKQVVFYSPGRSPRRELEAHGEVLLLPAEAQQQDMCLAQQQGASVPFALPPQSRPARQQQESEGNGGSTVRADMMQEYAEREGAAEAPYAPIVRPVAFAGGTRYSVGDRAVAKQESVLLAGQPAPVSLPETVPEGGSLWTAPFCPDVCGSQRDEDYVRDDPALLRGVRVRVDADTSLLRRPEEMLAYVPASEQTTPTETRATVQLPRATQTPLDSHAPPLGGEAVPEAVLPSESEAVVKSKLTTCTMACGSNEGAADPTRKGCTSLVGGFTFSGKRAGQLSRQRLLLHGDSEECIDCGDSVLAGQRTHAFRRGRCQRPASWKRVRQTMGERQLPYRGCDLLPTGDSHAAWLGAHVQRKHLEQQQKWNAQQGGKDARSTHAAANAVEERKRTMRTFEEEEEEKGEETLCRSGTEARGQALQQSCLQWKANARARRRLACQSDADAHFAASCEGQCVTSGVAQKAVVFLQDDMSGLDSYASQQVLRTGMGQPGAPKIVDCGKAERDVLQRDSPSSSSASVAGQPEAKQRKKPGSLVSSKAPPLSSVDRGDLCATCRGTHESYSERDGDDDDRGYTAASSPQTSGLTSDEGKDSGMSPSGRSLLEVSRDVSGSRQQLRTIGTSVRGIDTCERPGNRETGSDLRLNSELSSGRGEEDSRRRSIGPGKFDRFDEDTSGDESNVSVGETGSGPSRQLVSPPQDDLRARKSGRAASTLTGCPPPSNVSASMQSGWLPRGEDSPGDDVDEDEASRYFKRRRCSLLLWGGIRGDRGHIAVRQASLDSPTRSAHALQDARTGAEERDRNVADVNTTNAVQVNQVRQRQETRGGASVTAPRLDEARRKEQLSDEERPATGSLDEERTVSERPAITSVVAPTVRMTPDAPASSASALAPFPSRQMRKRKRGVGASASRLLFLQRPDYDVSNDDATLVNSLGSALTYEETQQLRRREQEQLQQELLRQQEEARRREEAAAARLKEHQKAAAAAIAAASATTLPSAPYVFGSATLAAPSSRGDATTIATSPVQKLGHTAGTVEKPPTPNKLIDCVTALPSAGSASDTNVHTPIPCSGTHDMYSTGQNIEQQQQVKEAALSGRPRLRIIRSPPSAGDSAVQPISVAVEARASSSEPCGADMAVSTLPASNEQNTCVLGPSPLQVGLPAAFAGAGGGFGSPQAVGIASVTQQSQMGGGLLPAEFGGMSVAPGAAGMGVQVSTAFGNAGTFGVANTGASSSGVGEDVRRLFGDGEVPGVRIRGIIGDYGGRMVIRGTECVQEE